MATSWLVPPSSSTGKSRRIELAGLDLLMVARIDNVFVYPSTIDIDRFKDALSRTLSLWPLVAGRFLLVDNDHYFIEMSDNSIPVSYTENTELEKWPTNMNVIIELKNTILLPFIDEIQTKKLMSGSEEEPLVRFKLTHLVKSGEWVLGTSWAHVLGDAASYINFLNTISRFYQHMEPLEPLPIFERRLWREDEADRSFFPMMKHMSEAQPLPAMMDLFMRNVTLYDQLNVSFSGAQLSKLRELAGGDSVTIQDSLSAYIIRALNKSCYKENDQRLIQYLNTTVNYRGVSDSIAPRGHVSNAIMSMLSDRFDDPFSLSSIAKTIRRSIIRSRDAKFLETWLATADGLMRKTVRESLMLNMDLFPNEATVNSNFRYDWANLVDFGYTDKCRYYTMWAGRLYIRIFHLNPRMDDNQWLPRDRDGVEIAFTIEKDLKENFLSTWKKDVAENFCNVE